MKQLFLTSTVSFVASDIAKRMDTKGKKLVFIYTAAEVEDGGKEADWCQDDRRSLVQIGFEVTDYSISNKAKAELAKDLAVFDVVYLSGGNTFYLLQQAQKSGFIEVVRDLVFNKNKTYMGTSAGSIIAGPDIYPVFRLDKASEAPDINGYRGFSLVNFCIFPHWGSEHFKDRYLNQRLEHAYREDQVPIIMITDQQYVLVEKNEFRLIEVNKK